MTPLILRPTIDQPGFGLGLAVGDVNGDGVSDVVVGSVLSSVNGSENAGQVFVFFGGPAPSTSPDLILSAPVPEPGARFGFAIAIGDVNGDGFNDIAASALFANGGPRNGVGAVYVFFGGPTLDNQADVTLMNPGSLEPPARFGFALGAGDLNADGIVDLVVGAENVEVDGAKEAGLVAVYFGNRSFDGRLGLTILPSPAERGAGFGSALAVADFDHDGIDDVAVGAPGQTAGGIPEAGQVFIFFGESPFMASSRLSLREAEPERLARFGVALAAGDVNGDGRQDLIVGATNAPLIPVGPQNRGEILIFFGGNPMSSTPSVAFDQRSVVGLGNPLGAGDVDRDGIADIIAGVPATNVGRRRAAGQTLIFFGGDSPGGEADILLQSPAPANNELFGSTVAAGDFNGDGLTDVIVGALNAVLGGGGGPGKVFVFLGQ